MTVSSSVRKQQYAGGQATNVFSFKSMFLHPEYIKVLKTLTSSGANTDLVYLTDYTVSLNADGVGGVVTFINSASTLHTTTVYRETEDLQDSDYDDYNQFPSDTLEGDLDKRTLISQERTDEVSRCLKLPISSSLTDIEMPSPVANAYLAWDQYATAIVNKTTITAITAGQLTISSGDAGKFIVVNAGENGIVVQSGSVYLQNGMNASFGTIVVRTNSTLATVTCSSLYVSGSVVCAGTTSTTNLVLNGKAVNASSGGVMTIGNDARPQGYAMKLSVIYGSGEASTDADQVGGTGAALTSAVTYTTLCDGFLTGCIYRAAGAGYGALIVNGVQMVSAGSSEADGSWQLCSFVPKGVSWSITLASCTLAYVFFTPIKAQ